MTRPQTGQSIYWHDQLGPAPALAEALVSRVDLLIVGSGYTGLNAAIVAARGGRSVLVVDAEDPGFGCSTRNGGQISTSIKPSLAQLSAKHDPERARAIRQEGVNALGWIADFIASEQIECDFRRAGRFHAAHTPAEYERLTRDAAQMQAEEGIESFAVPRAEQHHELGTDAYFGGVVYPEHCSLHPARFHRGLMHLALDAGAQILPHCRADRITRTGEAFRVTTSRGEVTARDVVVATNGYSGGLLPWLRRRVIPIGSYIIATDPLPRATMDRLFPTDRIVSDTCKVVYYYRTSPDRSRILFGGRVSASETDPAISGPKLHRDLARVFPELAQVGLSHSWTGKVAYSFDELVHTGQHDGIHYAVGYCGSGVSMASYLGMRLGQKVLGLREGRTALDDLPFPTRPFYTGRPWFLPTAVAYYRWRDQHQWGKAITQA